MADKATLVFSGPRVSAGQARNALARAGFVPHDGERAFDPHGLDEVEGEEFAAVTSPSGALAEAERVAVAYGWRVRAVRVEIGDAARGTVLA